MNSLSTATFWQLDAKRSELEALLDKLIAELDDLALPMLDTDGDPTCAVADDAVATIALLSALSTELEMRRIPAYGPVHLDCTHADCDVDPWECGCGGLCPDQCHRDAAGRARVADYLAGVA